MNSSSTNHSKQTFAIRRAELGLLCALTPNTAENDPQDSQGDR